MERSEHSRAKGLYSLLGPSFGVVSVASVRPNSIDLTGEYCGSPALFSTVSVNGTIAGRYSLYDGCMLRPFPPAQEASSTISPPASAPADVRNPSTSNHLEAGLRDHYRIASAITEIFGALNLFRPPSMDGFLSGVNRSEGPDPLPWIPL